VRTRKIELLDVACIASATTLGLFTLPQASAQQAPAGSQQGSSAKAAENNGQDFTRPENLFQFRYVYQTAPGSGSLPGTIRTVTTDRAVLRSDMQISVAPQWTLALRGDLPFEAKNPVKPDNPAGEYIYGIGDGDVQAALIKTLNPRWAVGAGARIVAPTGAQDLTSGKWQVLPMVGARVMLPELSEGSFFTALVRYDVSFAGDPSARNISNLQLAPTLNIVLPEHWFVTFYPVPDIRINYSDPVTGQTGRLFLPMDFLVGRNLTKNVIISLEIGVPIIKDYPVYDFKTVTRLNIKF
jgi:hypothetical protein